MKILIVIPALNEAARIRVVLGDLAPQIEGRDARIVVADGGSDDDTRGIVHEVARETGTVTLMANPARIQSAGINAAFRRYGADCDVLIRCDAHARYPADFVARLIETLSRTHADCVVVSLRTLGETPFQKALAAASNGFLGSGGAAHRGGGRSGDVEHGHHGAMRAATFRAVGGYDPTYAWNEDAELDCRIRAIGGRIHHAADIEVGYFPRDAFSALARQYFRYGIGRSRTARRHPSSLQSRHLALVAHPALLALSLCGAVVATRWAGLYAALYAAAVAAMAARIAGRGELRDGLLAAPIAATMHIAWGAGFLWGLARRYEPRWRPHQRTGLNALVVDPSQFTGPYDAALASGLESSGVGVTVVTRPLRPGEEDYFDSGRIERYFYRRTDVNARLPGGARPPAKGLDHILGSLRLIRSAYATGSRVVHFQWLAVPVLDLLTMALIRLRRPVIFTMHDTSPFNGDAMNVMQTLGLGAALRLASRVIVHTRSGRARLLERGVSPERIRVVPHGDWEARAPDKTPPAPDEPFVVVLFGQIKPYKGVDVLLDALAKLTPAQQRRLRIVIAGEAKMDIAPYRDRIREDGLSEVVRLRVERLSERQVTELFAMTDAFVFPYRQIDASGVYCMAKAQNRWLIASDVGLFAEEIVDGASGRLVRMGDAAALAKALIEAGERRPRPSLAATRVSWEQVGRLTRGVYEDALCNA